MSAAYVAKKFFNPDKPYRDESYDHFGMGATATWRTWKTFLTIKQAAWLKREAKDTELYGNDFIKTTFEIDGIAYFVEASNRGLANGTWWFKISTKTNEKPAGVSLDYPGDLVDRINAGE